MESERGSLQNKLQEYGKEPRPEILTDLQQKLAGRKRRRPIIWYWFAAAFVVGIISIPFLVNQPLSDQKLAGNSDKEKSVNSTKVQSKTTENSISNSSPSKQEELLPSGQNQPKKTNKTNNSNQDKVQDKSSNEIVKNSEGMFPQKAGHKNQSLVTPGITSDEEQINETENENPKRIHSGYKVNRKRLPIGAVAISKKSKSIKGNTGDVVKDFDQRNLQKYSSIVEVGKTTSSDKIPENEGSESKQAMKNQEMNSNVAVDAGRLNQPKDQTNTPDHDKNSKQTHKADFASPGIEQTGNQSLKQSIPAKDSLNKILTNGSVIALKSDSLFPKIAQPETIRKLYFTTLLSSRYSAIRYYAINQQKAEFRNELTNENAKFPSRMSFDLVCRGDLPISKMLGFYVQASAGFSKEDLYLNARSAVKNQFTKQISGNTLVINPVNQVLKERISASLGYVSTASGIRIALSKTLPVLRIGGGMQWGFWSERIQTLGKEELYKGRMTGASTGIWFLHASAGKEIMIRNSGTFVVEPVLQYFSRPTMQMKSGTSISTLQAGIQLGWKW